MAIFNQWGEGVDESLGDIIEEKLEEKVENTAKKGAKKIGKEAKKAVKKATEPIRKAMAKLAKEGIKAVGHAIKAAAKATVEAVKAIFSNPYTAAIAIIIIIIVVVIVAANSDDDDNTNHLQDDNVLLENETFINIDGMSDDDLVVILMTDCTTQSYDSINDAMSLDTEKEDQAKLIYSMFRSYGFNNVSIAGILGNMDREGSLDPFAIEGILSDSEWGRIGPRKAAAIVSLPAYTENVLFENYRNNGRSYSRDGYRVITSDGDELFYCGLGLVQWTGPNAYALLNAANTLGTDWYDMNFQMAYLVADCFFQPGFFSNWVVNQDEETDDHDTNVELARDAGYYFVRHFEGNTRRDDERRDSAEYWYNVIEFWDDNMVDTEYVDTVTALAAELGAIINFLEVENPYYRCTNGNIFDNSSLAAAAISFAHPRQDLSYNNGTPLYITVHDGLWANDYTYKACDRVVAAAVLWSGTDDDYPRYTPTQLSYLESSDKWEKIGSSSTVSVNDLLPGDVFCRNGHTFIYTGKEMINAAYGGDCDPNSNSVSGSLGTRSAACDQSATNSLGVSDPFGVYRCVNPDNSNTYKHIAAGN